MSTMVESFGRMNLFASHSPPPTPSSHFEQRTQRPVLTFVFPAPGVASSRAPCRQAIKAACVQGEVFSVTSTKSDVDYLGESTKGDLNVNREHLEAFGFDGRASLDGSIEEIARVEAKEAEFALNALGIVEELVMKTKDLGIARDEGEKLVKALNWKGLCELVTKAWEGRAYDYGMANLESMGFPVDGLEFDPKLVIRGLVMDKERGNLVKADRFGYVKRAMHGTKMLSTRDVSEIYGRELVDLRKESRWEFLNTLFSVSEAVMYMQAVSKALFRAHVEGQLKSEIMAEPERFIEPDPELPLALLDQKEAGKKLLLITNSDYHYTKQMMQHSFNRFLPNDMDWRDLFEMVIVSARKPEFFQMSHPLYEIVTNDGLMRPCFKAKSGPMADTIERDVLWIKWVHYTYLRRVDVWTWEAVHLDSLLIKRLRYIRYFIRSASRSLMDVAQRMADWFA
ncbi:hypothetical protein ZIOFF_066831 [Zingiber officinale]|uniref:Uncharacterized protein n=1 Tax=Zingiber officinale TaxID=94328 RepID=A0A8J5EYR2_ZINOF|nr:hypothetical protein ZIOFF_066831 [Zingiber officinale]